MQGILDSPGWGCLGPGRCPGKQPFWTLYLAPDQHSALPNITGCRVQAAGWFSSLPVFQSLPCLAPKCKVYLILRMTERIPMLSYKRKFQKVHGRGQQCGRVKLLHATLSPFRVLVQVPETLIQIKFHANQPGRAMKDDVIIGPLLPRWKIKTAEVPGSQLHPGPALAVGSCLWNEPADGGSPSLTSLLFLPFKQTFSKNHRKGIKS